MAASAATATRLFALPRRGATRAATKAARRALRYIGPPGRERAGVCRSLCLFGYIARALVSSEPGRSGMTSRGFWRGRDEPWRGRGARDGVGLWADTRRRLRYRPAAPSLEKREEPRAPHPPSA